MQQNSIQDEAQKVPRRFASKDLLRLTRTDLQQREQLAQKTLQLNDSLWSLLRARHHSDQSEVK